MEDEMNRRTILTMLAAIPGFGFIAVKPAAALRLDNVQEYDRREMAKRRLPCVARATSVNAYRDRGGKCDYYINARTDEGASFMLYLNDGESHPFVSKLVTGELVTVIITETEWRFPALGVTIETVGHQPGLYLYRAKGNLNEAA
jgi:hypothetical protein